MGLIECRECGHSVSDRAEACPECGCPVQPSTTSAGSPADEDERGRSWKAWLGVTVVAVSLLALIAVAVAPDDPVDSGKSTAENRGESDTDNPEAEWVRVETFQSRGNQQTRPFDIRGNRWRVEYESKPTKDEGIGHAFGIQAMRPDQNVPVTMIAGSADESAVSGESHVYQSGEFYLKVNAANGEWEIRVYDYR